MSSDEKQLELPFDPTRKPANTDDDILTKSTNSMIHTYTGREVDPLNLNPDDVLVNDIAFALSNQARFTGHAKRIYNNVYTVAQHCLNVACYVGRKFTGQDMSSFNCRMLDLRLEHRNIFLQALLHDASEAYLIDLPRPIKHDPRLAAYREIEYKIQDVIMDAYDLPRKFHDLIHEADDYVLSVEAYRLMNKSHPYWKQWFNRFPKLENGNYLVPHLLSYTHKEIENRYLEVFYYLRSL